MGARPGLSLLAVLLVAALVAPAAGQPVAEDAGLLIAGGPAAVPQAVEDGLVAATGTTSVRVAGSNRFATAAAVAEAFGVGSPAFIAWGGGPADALAGGPAAAVAGGPVLLTETAVLPTETVAALHRLAPSSITILGGEAVVSAAVAEELEAFTDGAVQRLAGPDRYATAAAIAATFEAPAQSAWVVSGESFADALAASQAAGLAGVPVLLTRPDSLPEVTAAALDALQPGRIVLVGGTAAVSEEVESDLAALTEGPVQRLAGDTRFTTALSVAVATYPGGADRVFLASGNDFPDALAISPVAAGGLDRGGFAQLPAGTGDGPLVLVTDPLPDVVRDGVVALLSEDPVLPPAGNGQPTVQDLQVEVSAGGVVEVTLLGEDPDGDALTYAIATPPDRGSATVEGDVAAYMAAGGGYTTTFTYTAADGQLTSAEGTVTVTVGSAASPPPDNLPPGNLAPTVDLDPGGPAAPDLTVAFTEDGGPVPVAPAAVVADLDDAELVRTTLTLTSRPDGVDEQLAAAPAGAVTVAAYDPATGQLVLEGPAPLADFESTLRTVTYDNVDQDPDASDRTVQVQADDGQATSTVATSTVTVTALDDAPVAAGDAATVLEDAGATPVDVLANDGDVDGGPVSVGSVTQPANGSVGITNAGADLTYAPDADACNDGAPTDDFTYTLNGGSTTTVSVTVTCVDDPPLAVDDAATVGEDDPATTIDVLANDTDVDGGGVVVVNSVTQPADGVVANNGTDVSYTPGPDACNDGAPTDDFTYTLDGGSTATVSVTVTCVDDAPVANDDTASVTEDDPATAIDVLGNDTDVDAGPKAITAASDPANGTVVVAGDGSGLTYQPDADFCNTPPGAALDTFTYTLAPGGSTATVSVTVTCLDDPPTAVSDVATVVEDSGANAIDVLVNDTDPDGGVQSVDLVTQPTNGTVVITGGGTGLTYAPDTDYCNDGVALDTFSYTLNGGGSASVSVTVTCVDDLPSAVDDAATVAEDSGTSAIDVLANDTDPDGGVQSVDLVTQPTDGTVVITGGGTGLTYAPDANFCNGPPGGVPDTFTYTLNGGSSATVSVTVTCVNDAPTVVDEGHQTVGNTVLRFDNAAPQTGQVHVAGDLLDNESDVENDPLAVVAATSATANGGSVTIEVDGAYTYTPPAGSSAPDTFTYTVSDGTDTSDGTVTVTPQGMVWYVDDSAAGGGLGRSGDPFDTLGEAQTASLAGQTIYVRAGNTAVTPLGGGIALKDGQRLLGEAVALTVPVSVNGGANPTILRPAGTRPRIGNVGAGGNGVTVLGNTANGNRSVLITGLDIAGNANAIDYTLADAVSGSLTIVDAVIRAAGAEGIDVNQGSSGTLTVALDTVIVTATGTGIDLTRTAGTLAITTFASLTIHGDTGGAGVAINGPATFDPTPGGALTTVNAGTAAIGTGGNPVGGAGLVLANVTGELSFIDLDVFTAAGAGISVSGTGAFDGGAGIGTRIAVTPAAATVSTTGGPAVSLSNLTTDLQLSQLTVASSPSSGINLTTVAGTFSAPAGSSIASAAGTDVNVDGSNPTVMYGGTISNTGGRSVSIQNMTGGGASFSGAIDDSGTGILINNNAGTASRFSGGVTLSTGVAPALTATSGGSIAVTGSANSITTTTGTALNVANTTIHGDGLTFRSIAAGTAGAGPANGIVLNTTGAGALTVTGSASTDGSGGTIRNTTGDGVVLTNTAGAALTNMVIGDPTAVPGQPANATNTIGGDGLSLSNADNVTLTNTLVSRTAAHGIDGTGVTNLALTDSEVLNAGDGNDEHALAFDDLNANNLDGTVTITNSVIDAFAEDGISVENFSGTLNLTVSGSTIGRNANTLCGGFRCGENGIQVRADGTAVANLTVTGNTFLPSVDGNGILFVSEGTAATASRLIVDDTTISGATALGIVAFGGTGDETSIINSRLNFTLDGVTVTGSGSTAVSIQPNGDSSVQGTVRDSTINGSASGRGIEVLSDDAADAAIAITGNTVSNTAFNGIFASNQNIGRLDVHIRNNTVAAPTDTTPPSGLTVHGTEVNVRQSSVNCLDIAGNSSAGTNGGAGFRTRQRDTSTFSLERFTGNAGNATVVGVFLANQNTAGTGSATVNTTYTAVADGACLDPAT